MLITTASIKVNLRVILNQPITKLQWISYNNYLIQFNKQLVRAFIKFGNEINEIQSSFVKKPSFHIWKIDIRAYKIDSSTLKTFGIVIASFLVNDKKKKSQFFEMTGLLADISIDIALEISLLTLSNTKVNFIDQEFK